MIYLRICILPVLRFGGQTRTRTQDFVSKMIATRRNSERDMIKVANITITNFTFMWNYVRYMTQLKEETYWARVHSTRNALKYLNNSQSIHYPKIYASETHSAILRTPRNADLGCLHQRGTCELLRGWHHPWQWFGVATSWFYFSVWRPITNWITRYGQLLRM